MHDFRSNEKYLSLMPDAGTGSLPVVADPRSPFLDSRVAGTVT